MKTLYLVRHAKSSWKHPELSDFERPLNKRGKNDAPFMGKLLFKKGINPELLISSPAKRASSTAKIIASELNYDKEKISFPIANFILFGLMMFSLNLILDIIIILNILFILYARSFVAKWTIIRVCW